MSHCFADAVPSLLSSDDSTICLSVLGYGCVSPCSCMPWNFILATSLSFLCSTVLVIEPRALHTLAKCCSTELWPHNLIWMPHHLSSYITYIWTYLYIYDFWLFVIQSEDMICVSFFYNVRSFWICLWFIVTYESIHSHVFSYKLISLSLKELC